MVLLLLIVLPHLQVAHFNITDPKDLADTENSYRATLAQILGGITVGVGIYFAWKNLDVAKNTLDSNIKMSQDSLKVSQEGQITERFTRAVDQLGSSSIEIRLGGIYGLGRIANESDKDYWPIMQILTSFIQQRSPYPEYINVSDIFKEKDKKMTQCEFYKFIEKSNIEPNGKALIECWRKINVPSDVEGAIDVIRQRKYLNCKYKDLNCPTSKANKEPKSLYIFGTNLCFLDLNQVHLEEAVLSSCFLPHTQFENAFLQTVNFTTSFLVSANFCEANLEEAIFSDAELTSANFSRANLSGANFCEANLEEAVFCEANLEGANLIGAKNLTVGQLSDVKTLYNAKLDREIKMQIRKKYPHLFERPIDET